MARELRARWKSEPWSSLALVATKPFTARRSASWSLTAVPILPGRRHDLRGLTIGAEGANRTKIGRIEYFILKKSADLLGKTLGDVDLSYASLPYLQAQEAVFKNILFHGTNLFQMAAQSARFQDVMFENIAFEADLGRQYGGGPRPVFENCAFDSCTFVDAEIRDAVIKNCRFSRVRFGDGSGGRYLCSLAGNRFEDCIFDQCIFDMCMIGGGGNTYSDGGFFGCRFDSCTINRSSWLGRMTISDLSWSGKEVLVIQTGYRTILERVLHDLRPLAKKAELKELETKLEYVTGSRIDSHMTTKDGLPVPKTLLDRTWELMKRYAAAQTDASTPQTRKPATMTARTKREQVKGGESKRPATNGVGRRRKPHR